MPKHPTTQLSSSRPRNWHAHSALSRKAGRHSSALDYRRRPKHRHRMTMSVAFMAALCVATVAICTYSAQASPKDWPENPWPYTGPTDPPGALPEGPLFCSTLEKLAYQDKVLLDCVYYDGVFHINTAENFKYDKWGLYALNMLIASSEVLVRAKTHNRYRGLIFTHDNDSRKRLGVNFNAFFICTAIWARDRIESNYRQCLIDIAQPYHGQYD